MKNNTLFKNQESEKVTFNKNNIDKMLIAMNERNTHCVVGINIMFALKGIFKKFDNKPINDNLINAINNLKIDDLRIKANVKSFDDTLQSISILAEKSICTVCYSIDIYTCDITSNDKIDYLQVEKFINDKIAIYEESLNNNYLVINNLNEFIEELENAVTRYNSLANLLQYGALRKLDLRKIYV